MNTVSSASIKFSRDLHIHSMLSVLTPLLLSLSIRVRLSVCPGLPPNEFTIERQRKIYKPKQEIAMAQSMEKIKSSKRKYRSGIITGIKNRFSVYLRSELRFIIEGTTICFRCFHFLPAAVACPTAAKLTCVSTETRRESSCYAC